MCRIAAYLGPRISLGKFLLEPCHSLYYQSWQPREMEDAKLNADGFGFAWLNSLSQMASYTNTQPIWSDQNLTSLSDSLYSGYWLANVRSATINQQATPSNIHPFKSDQIVFTHNGYIENFNLAIRTKFHEILTPAIQSGIQGNTDSEYIFALLRQQLMKIPNIAEALPVMMEIFTDILAGGKALLNIIVGDGHRFCVMRHAINGNCPSLYFSTTEDDMPDAIAVASEAMTESGHWEVFPEHSYATMSNHAQPTFLSL